MSKVICDICGTVYPESSENCPVCGCSRDFGLDAYEEELLMDAAGFVADSRQNTKKKTREIFDFDEVNPDDEPEEENDSFDDEDDDAEASGSNTVLVVILLVLIVLLLVTAGYFFIRYFLPNMAKETEPTQTTAVVETVETEPEETTEPTIPCSDIVIPGGKIELGKDGLWLLNVQVYPENTTDTLAYVSYDESVVTVDEGGTVKAVSEGTTIIEITCGNKQIKCNVVVDYNMNVATEATDAVPAPQVDATGATEAAAATEPASTEATQETQATEAPKETTGNTELKLKKTDITMFARYSSVDLELDCDIPAENIEWFTMDSTVAIVHGGKVTATGSGITRVYAKYGSQQVECIVRCSF